MNGNSMYGGECDYEPQAPRTCDVCGEEITVDGCRCDRERREARIIEEAFADDWTNCDFCGEPVRIRHYCPECSRFCEERTEEVAS